METTKQPQGTTLAVLAPYLAYGIEVECPLPNNPYGEVMRRRLVGLNTESEIAALSNETTIWAGHCIPVLRPFAALVTPLPDGTVPAVEVAKLIFDLNEHHCEDGYLAGIAARLNDDGDIGVYLPGVNGASAILYNDWNIWADEAMTPYAAYDYLRSQHFAVGLAPHQYIVKEAAQC